MINIYCKTSDGPKNVGKLLCRTNSVQDKNENYSWIVNKTEDDSWIIETNCNQSPDGIIYRIGNEVVCIEVDDNCAPKVIEPLIEKYGFDNIKWLLTQ